MTTGRRSDDLEHNRIGAGASPAISTGAFSATDGPSLVFLDQEIAFYLEGLPGWRDHEGEHVLIAARQAYGFYPTRDDALAEGFRRFGRVPFLVKRVAVDEAPRVMVGLIR